MPNPILNQPLQNLAAGDDLALALKEYGGMVMGAFSNATKFTSYGMKKVITSGSSHQFPFLGEMTAAEHTQGTDLTGNNEPPTEERTIPIDTKEIVSHAWFSTVQEFISHFDTRQQRATEAAAALARTVDIRAARMLIKGAKIGTRTAGSYTFPGGSTLTSPRTGPIATAYPLSLAGSRALQDDLGEIAQKMDEKNIPSDNRQSWLTPYLHRVLRQDNTLASREFVDPATGDKTTRILSLVEGFRIEQTNQMPTTNVTTGEAAYQGDYSKTVAICAGHPTAVGTLMFRGVDPFGPTWFVEKRSWLIGAAIFQGIKWLRPEACGVIELA